MAKARQVLLADEAATTRLGADLARALSPGDLLLLEGDLGAGKSTLARGLIRALAGDPDLDVPSPTFTLVQTYGLSVPVSHFDLYRLSSPDEMDELGLDDALGGIALVEWPERAGDRLPADAIRLRLDDAATGRAATISGPDAAMDRIGRSLDARDFLAAAGWGEAQRWPLAGDASARSYETVVLKGEAPRLLMNAPPLLLGPPVRDGRAYAEIAHTARTVAAFVAVDRVLGEAGVSVPEIYAQDLDRGFLLVGHLGDGSFLDDGRPVAERYAAAAELLADMHGRSWPRTIPVAPGVSHAIPPFDRPAMMIEVDLLLDWYVPFTTGLPADDDLRRQYGAAWNVLFDRLADKETSIVLRDVQSPNFIWRPERKGRDRLGVIDFQDALIGPSAYDVASLALDPRVTITPELERSTVDAYVAARLKAGEFDADAFAEAYAIMAAQRHSKILGIFVRLKQRDGKPQYLRHLPRIQDYLRRALRHPALARLAELYERAGFLRSPA